MFWLISANSNIYEHSRSFSDYGFVDWKQGKTKYKIGDIVYIYVTRPEKKIRYKCIVDKVNLTEPEIRNDKEYWVNPSEYEESLTGNFVRLKLVERSNNEILDLDRLRENGLINAPQGPKKLSGQLLKYIDKNFTVILDQLIERESIEVKQSLSIDSKTRQERISKAPRKPKRIKIVTYVYERSPDIIAEALIRADGICEKCRSPAPFMRKKDKTPYLEVHHKKQLSNGGEDSIENVEALCPNCHRAEHYGF